MAIVVKGKDYIEEMRKKFLSPSECLDKLLEKYGDDAEEKITLEDAHDVFKQSIEWGAWNDMPMQDFWADMMEYEINFGERDHDSIGERLLDSLDMMIEHLERGEALGLSPLEQRVVDTLYSWVPHRYDENYVECARELSRVILNLLPPEDVPRTLEGYRTYLIQLEREVNRLTNKYEVDYIDSEYNLSTWYFIEWLRLEYGFYEMKV